MTGRNCESKIMRKLETKKLVLATHNSGKLAEFADLFAPFGFELVSAGQLGFPVPEETGTQFEENAYIKAFASAKASRLPALADDSGLEIEALGGAPGVYTADWAEQADGSRDFVKAMEKVERELQKVLAKKAAAGAVNAEQDTAKLRRGRFVSVLCLAWPDGAAEYFRGEVTGQLVWPPRGSKGFGFDPVFQPDGYQKSFGEMPAQAKHGWRPWNKRALSHRARAFKAFAEAKLGAAGGKNAGEN